LLFPDDSFTKIWSSIISIILIYVTFALSFELAFVDETNLFFELNEYITSAFFIIDIIINFNISFYDKKGKLVVSRSKITCRYLKCWFIIDFVSSFPFYLITDTGKESILQSIKTLKIFKYFKIIRILRLLKFIKRFFPQHLKNRSKKDFIKFKSNTERMTEHLFIALIFAHCFSCLFYALPMFISPEMNWVILRNLQIKTPFEKYLFSLHWMIETMITVGYGENSF
jgi:hyperpolarization activated cyclic nucleotide-gated potassium channel 2